MIRKRQFGRAVAGLNHLVLLMDSAILWSALSAKALLKRDGHHAQRQLGRVDYAARMAGSIGVLVLGERYVRRMNDQCWKYFNNGARPPLPPEPMLRVPWHAEQ
jgi:hypothetical protein